MKAKPVETEIDVDSVDFDNIDASAYPVDVRSEIEIIRAQHDNGRSITSCALIIDMLMIFMLHSYICVHNRWGMNHFMLHEDLQNKYGVRTQSQAF